MKIEIVIEEKDLTPEELSVFYKNLGISGKQKTELAAAMNDIAKTAFMEYKDMICKSGIPDKAEEVRQNRLELLIKFYYKDKLPKESEIQTTFQLSSTASKTLLKNTRSKKRSSLEPQIRKSVHDILSNATQIKEKYRLEIKSENVLQEINELISEKGPGLYKVRAVRGIASLYECEADTMELLRTEYGL